VLALRLSVSYDGVENVAFGLKINRAASAKRRGHQKSA
jgi:hypothetical protein